MQAKDELARLDGVGDVQVFGAGQFSMRVWLDPDRVASRGLTADDVVRAIREQNIQVAAGQLGAPPLPSATEFQVAINAKGRLTTEDDFRNVIIKTGDTGQVTRLKNVARVELGADTYALRALLDNKAAAAIPIFQRPGSNAIAISELVRAKMQELKKDFRKASTTTRLSMTPRRCSCAVPSMRWYTRCSRPYCCRCWSSLRYYRPGVRPSSH